MENAITAGLSNQLALVRALDITANNIANQTTDGFKAERVNFSEFVSYLDDQTSGDPDISLVYEERSYTDFSVGGLQATRAPLDFAISGDGYFAVQTNDGVRYTRDGHFGLNAFGELANRDGHLVLDDRGSPILIDPEVGPLLVGKDGELQQDGVAIARLGVFEPSNPQIMRRTGANLFAADETLLTPSRAIVQQGFVETSNVDPVREMTNIIEIMRAYESAAQIVETANELARDAVEQLTQTT